MFMGEGDVGIIRHTCGIYGLDQLEPWLGIVGLCRGLLVTILCYLLDFL